MAKTVNASIVVTRDGTSSVQNFPGMGYATFVALQSSLGASMAAMQSWGAIRVAELIEARGGENAAGDCDLRLELRADHGSGTSEFVVGYTGLSAKEADDVVAMMSKAVSAAVPASKKA